MTSPAQFLTLNYRIDFPEMIDIEGTNYIPGISSSRTLLETWKNGQRLLSDFGKSGKMNQCYHKNNRIKSERDPHIGHVVLIQEDQLCSQWQIEKLFSF